MCISWIVFKLSIVEILWIESFFSSLLLMKLLLIGFELLTHTHASTTLLLVKALKLMIRWLKLCLSVCQFFQISFYCYKERFVTC